MATILLGHGVVDAGSEPVLVPPGYKLTFYSDFGSKLVIPAVEDSSGNLLSDYTQMSSVWETYKSAGYVGEYDVTYNMQLHSEDYQAEIDLATNADWGATVALVGNLGGHVSLCTGTPRDPETGAGTCPTPALLVKYRELEAAGDSSSFDDEWWKHDCDGILGRLGDSLPDKDIYWMACSGFEQRVYQQVLGDQNTAENREELFGDRDVRQDP
jgi:hypothetical protein